MSYFVRYLTKDEEHCLVVFSSRLSLLWWFLTKAHGCYIIHIWTRGCADEKI